MHSRKNLSFLFVASGFSLLLCLLRFFATAQTFTDGACFRFLMEQICHIPFAVVHYHRIVFLVVAYAGFY